MSLVKTAEPFTKIFIEMIARFCFHIFNPKLFCLDIFVSLQFSDLGTVVKSRGRIW